MSNKSINDKSGKTGWSAIWTWLKAVDQALHEDPSDLAMRQIRERVARLEEAQTQNASGGPR